MPHTSFKHHWVITRPKRKLIIVPELLKVFSAVAVGHRWLGNRALQRQFEAELVKFQWKAQNESNDGSGSRTYAALLFMLGLWFQNNDGVVELTKAGEEIVASNPPVPILTKQLLDFQYPSAYSIHRNVNIDRSFRVQPHRLVVQLLLSKKLSHLTQDEIAFCLVPFAKDNENLEEHIERINTYRKSPAPLIEEALRISRASRTNLSHIANTLLNQLEYTGLFNEREEVHFLEFAAGGHSAAEKLLKERRSSLIQNPENQSQFQMRYGSGLQTTKDYRNTNPVSPSINPIDRLVLLAYYEQTLNEPIEGISAELIERIASQKGVPSSRVSRVLAALANQPLMDRFEEMYLRLARGGRETAAEFELKTRGIFAEQGFGLRADWVGPKPLHPDIFVYLEPTTKKFGIIDTKAYSEYSCTIDQRNKMAHTYVPRYKEMELDGVKYNLAFFCYIAGGYSSTMPTSFNQLLAMTNTPGSYITAYNFLQLLRLHRQKPFSSAELIEVFSTKGEINYDHVQMGRSGTKSAESRPLI